MWFSTRLKPVILSLMLSLPWLVSSCGPAGDAYNYTVTPGGSHVTFDPEGSQTLPINETQSFTVTPEAGYILSPIVVGNCATGAWEGNVYTTGPITNNCTAFFSAVLPEDQNGGAENDPIPNASPSPTPVATTNLEISLNALALAINGNSRILTLTNTGNSTAHNVSYVISPALPQGSSISPESCGNLEAGVSCVLTLIPGNTSNAAPGELNPESSILSASGDNTNLVHSSIAILEYGSVYQAGYLFDINDTTPNSSSIDGKVAALSDQSGIYPNGALWSSNGNGPSEIDGIFDDIPGILETSISPPDNCNGATEGSCNNAILIDYYASVNPDYYAAGICAEYEGGNYEDWYLPSLCEMSYGDGGCGTTENPTTENMQSNLAENGNIGSLLEASSFPSILAWYHNFNFNNQFPYFKNGLLTVRCVRKLSE